MENTPDCGKASVASGTTGTTGTGTGVAQNTQGGSSQTNNVYAIVSTFQMVSDEILNLRFNYDRRQTKGAINPQQGFSLTGGTFGNSVTGRQGTIEWGQAGINLNTSVTNQQINFLQVDLALKGSFVAGQGTTNQPNVCNTQDGVNCTAGQANTQCFTVDNRVCLVDTNSADAKQIDIRGKITCFAPTIF
ncbi:hypothetical protein [Leptospira sp. GIMC2001]|uniref:hypothetical protein n=1 Tax=Leptospira sp. GIMC2001 TaxID=1513297 RepID=UPI00234971B8|nr:hypothetical protein [Leptospira sp. GIMC2001]WCL49848.1 hypothetical protein O4O04_03240 [Leptospira sp. GIMC2001]